MICAEKKLPGVDLYFDLYHFYRRKKRERFSFFIPVTMFLYAIRLCFPDQWS